MTFQSNAYLIGDQHNYIMVKNTKNVSEGNSGSNVLWDFTYLEGGDSLTSYLLDATQQEGNEYFPESNIVIHEDGRNYFFNVSTTGMDEYGYAVANNILKYEKPLKRFSFPFIYGEELEGTYSGEKIGSEGNKIAGIYKSRIDGYGTLLLPGNVEYKNVLRVRTSKRKDSSETEEVSYRWYLQNTDPVLRYPLLSIAKIETSAASFVRIAGYHINTLPLAEKEGTLEKLFSQQEFISPEASSLFKLKVYPNPFIDKVNVDYELPVDAKITIVVSDALGKRIETLVDNNQKAGVYSAEFKGTRDHFVYFVTTFINGNIVNSKKLIHVKKQ